jgi:hypothetical protein
MRVLSMGLVTPELTSQYSPAAATASNKTLSPPSTRSHVFVDQFIQRRRSFA